MSTTECDHFNFEEKRNYQPFPFQNFEVQQDCGNDPLNKQTELF